MHDPAPSLRALSRGDLHDLLQRREGPLVSIYLPLQRSFPGAEQNVVRLRHAAGEAAERLAAARIPPSDVQARREQIEAVALRIAGLAHPLDGLAIFQDRTSTQAFLLARAVSDRVVVGETFELRPLLRALHANRRYRVLAVSVNRVALYEGDARGLVDAPRNGVPESLEAALGSEVTEKNLRLRAGGQRGPTQGYASHGADSAHDERKRDVEQYLAVLATALEERLRGDDDPLVLAGEKTQLAALRSRLHLPGLVTEGVEGNADHLGHAELHARAWPLIQRVIAARDATLADAWERARNHGKTVDLLDDVAAAACAGRVRRLWLAQERRVPGHVDAATSHVVEDASAQTDALEELAEIVLRHGGEVCEVEASRMPTRGPVAAELR